MAQKISLHSLLDICNEISPFSLQESWDNSGLILGDPNAEITAVALSLEADENAIAAAQNGSCLIAHHPLIFSPLKQLDLSTYPAKLLALAIHKNISLIAMHTNFDRTHLNRYVAKEILGWQESDCDGFICTSKFDGSFDELLSLTREKFGAIKSAVSTDRRIKKVALIAGSGGSFAGETGAIDADALITGDLKYHDAIAAKTAGIGVIDAGHYETERDFPLVLHAALKDALKEKGINAIIAPSKNPFSDGIR
ncbi:GTP cyclohydrolase 1 type 2 [Campylobacterota bacterium]|nr:GTP cyclohydrolase 1 type 2 [Campylobacterota bacterium]